MVADTLRRIAAEHPEDPVAQLQLRGAEAIAAMSIFFVEEISAMEHHGLTEDHLCKGFAACLAMPLVNVLTRSTDPHEGAIAILQATYASLGHVFSEDAERDSKTMMTVSSIMKDVGDA